MNNWERVYLLDQLAGTHPDYTPDSDELDPVEPTDPETEMLLEVRRQKLLEYE